MRYTHNKGNNENSKKPILNEASAKVKQAMSKVGLDYYDNHNEYIFFMKMAYSGVVIHAE